jgi:RNA polymerase sigma factor (sigma-70 family)
MAATAVPLRSRRRSQERSIGAVGDDRLVARVRAGDDTAFEAIYDRYHRGLLSFCRHMLGSRHEAEDALQHSFASAYRALRGGSSAIELRPWLYTIARNRCLSALRSQRDEVDLDGLEIERGTLDGLPAQIQRRAELRELVDDLQRLPQDQRAALVLFELGDHSHEEIGAVLGVRREKVKALVFQARAALLRAREARDASCLDIREQLATLAGPMPARGMLRAHIDRCEGCAAFAHDVRHQRRALAAILPAVPTAGLKASVLGFALGGGGGAAALTAGGGGVTAAGVMAAGGATGGAGSVGIAAGAIGTATVAGGVATGTAGHVAGSVAGATAKGLVAKLLAVVAVAGGAAHADKVVSTTPMQPTIVTANQGPLLTPAGLPPTTIAPPQAVSSRPAALPSLLPTPAPAASPAPLGTPVPDPARADVAPAELPLVGGTHQGVSSTSGPTVPAAPAPDTTSTTTSTTPAPSSSPSDAAAAPTDGDPAAAPAGGTATTTDPSATTTSSTGTTTDAGTATDSTPSAPPDDTTSTSDSSTTTTSTTGPDPPSTTTPVDASVSGSG